MTDFSGNPAPETNLDWLFTGVSHALQGDRLRRVMEDALQLEAAQPARPVIIGQINVLKATHGWIARLADDPAATISLEDAIRDIQDAIMAGMRGEQL